jgi:kynurenine 3-monooxygenase
VTAIRGSTNPSSGVSSNAGSSDRRNSASGGASPGSGSSTESASAYARAGGDTASNSTRLQPLNIVGAGLAGALLAVLLARRGYPITLYDRRPDPRETTAEGGRSINLALAARGIRALERAGVMDRIRPLLITMRGRMVHDLSGATTLQPYGQREHEVIYSVGRAALNRVLIEEAARYNTVTLRFNQTCLAADPARNALRFRDTSIGDRSNTRGAGGTASATDYETPLTPTIATDGAGSAIRQSLVATQHVTAHEAWLDHDYKELTIPAQTAASKLDGNSLHIWPRGGFMLIALPNTDGSFTATLFLARTGINSFASLKDADAVSAFFRREFPDAQTLMPNLTRDFAANPQGQLGTVHLTPWHVGGSVLLLGDAAHAIVPFHGQGMNAAFEDCAVLDSLLDRHATTAQWEPLFAELSASRRPNADAIAAMALENYTEMRDTVLDAGFVRRKSIAMDLERRFPDRFIPRYSMVMFHPEIPYAEALRRGEIQAEILVELDAKREATTGNTNAALAEQLVTTRLKPLVTPS